MGLLLGGNFLPMVGTSGAIWKFLDRFSTDRAAGAIGATAAEPGPGNRAVTDPNSIWSIASGVLRINGTTTGTTQGYAYGPFVRREGRALRVKVLNRTTLGGNTMTLGFGIGNAAAPSGQPLNQVDIQGVSIISNNAYHAKDNFNSFNIVGGLSSSNPHELLFILRHNGAILLASNAADSSYVLMTVLRGLQLDQEPYIWAKIQPRGTTAYDVSFDDFEILDLAGVDDYSLATAHTAVVAANTTITAGTAGILEFTWIAESGVTLDIQLRRTDDNNCVIIRCVQGSSTIGVYTKSSGSETLLGSTAAQTWTVGTAYRIVCYYSTTALDIYVDLVQKLTPSTSFNNSATGAKVTRGGLELAAWPATVAKSTFTPLVGRSVGFTGTEYMAEVVRLRQALAAGGTHSIVYLGGSITNGQSASDLEATSWRALMSDWFDAQFPTATITHVNSGVGGTNSWYGLVRLATDVVAHDPVCIFLDFAVNDSSAAWDQPSAEALVRLIRTNLPDATIICPFFIQVTDKNVNDATNLKQPINDWWRKLCMTYRIPWFDFSGYVQQQVANGVPLATWFEDNIHPNDVGHAAIAAGFQSILSQTSASDAAYDWSTHVPILTRFVSSAIYENAPTITNGVDGTTSGSGWSTVATARQSSTANDTIAFTATCHSFGLDTNIGGGSGVVGWSVDGGGYTNIDLTLLGETYQPVTTFTRGAHTITLKVVSGTVRINRFLAI